MPVLSPLVPSQLMDSSAFLFMISRHFWIAIMADDEPVEIAICPKCRGGMVYVTAMPHPRAPQMQQTTFVCYPCNRTWNYALSSEMAAAYATPAALQLGKDCA